MVLPRAGLQALPASHDLQVTAQLANSSVQELLKLSRTLEGQLMQHNQEKAVLEAEYAKMPTHAGRTLKERRRKAEIEGRLDQLHHDISAARLQLKQLGVK